MNLEFFFTLHSRFYAQAFRVSACNLMKDDCNRLKIGEHQGILFPIQFKQSGGNKIYDLMDTGRVSFYLISNKIKVQLEKNNLTGWGTYEINIFDKKDNQLPGFYGFFVSGKCGPVDYSKAPIIEKRLVPNGPLCKFYKGLYIGLDKWDGTDFFIPEDRNEIIITQKAADVLIKNKFTNIELKNLRDHEGMID